MRRHQKIVQDCFIRVCKDSGFTIDAFRAAKLTGAACGLHPLLVWANFRDVQQMEEIAAGKHPACRS